ncbi:MAG: AmmeMemoRadiSam system radical SAM enzyme [Planctomycetota bacterium]|nr:AmmeMemoRadiSam system radical SAM enzyme [Planctomycetota bacterium]
MPVSSDVKSSGMSRREFARKLAASAAAAACAGGIGPALARHAFGEEKTTAPGEAMFYERLEDNEVQCRVCPRECIIQDGKTGFCNNRANTGGTLKSLVYGKPCSIDAGPIEKAPLFHFRPGHIRLCLSTVGCNMRCKHCQNWQTSQAKPNEVLARDLPPKEAVQLAQKEKEIKSVCFTFTEPTVFYEYVHDTSKAAQEAGLATSIVSNGYINEEPLKRLLPVLSAVKIDLKSFSPKFYEDVCEGKLEPVLETLKTLKAAEKHFEIVYLVIPTLNDSIDEIGKMCEWIKKELGDRVPLHFTRFHPEYKLKSLPPTPTKTLESAIGVAKGCGLKYVYIGNVPGHENNSTFCAKCGKRIIYRIHFGALENFVEDGKCKFCGEPIPGVW